jgi:hypothetical protein
MKIENTSLLLKFARQGQKRSARETADNLGGMSNEGCFQGKKGGQSQNAHRLRQLLQAIPIKSRHGEVWDRVVNAVGEKEIPGYYQPPGRQHVHGRPQEALAMLKAYNDFHEVDL